MNVGVERWKKKEEEKFRIFIAHELKKGKRGGNARRNKKKRILKQERMNVGVKR